MADHQYTDIKFEIKGQIGIITVNTLTSAAASLHISNAVQFNRPKALNSFGGNIIENTISALRVLNEHPDTIFTVLTGEGRFFSAGADVKGIGSDDVRTPNNHSIHQSAC
jgi:peroxisomal 3,2-trans-enoyl-CoA isomerase